MNIDVDKWGEKSIPAKPGKNAGLNILNPNALINTIISNLMGKNVLDIGGGCGIWDARFLLAPLIHLTVIELSHYASNEISQTVKRYNDTIQELNYHTRLRIIRADFFSSKYKESPRSIDVVCMLHIMHLFRPDQALLALSKIHGFLKDKDSRLYIRTNMPSLPPINGIDIMSFYKKFSRAGSPYPGYMIFDISKNSLNVTCPMTEAEIDTSFIPIYAEVIGARVRRHSHFLIEMETMRKMLGKTGFEIIEIYAESGDGHRFYEEPSIDMLTSYGKKDGMSLNVIAAPIFVSTSST
jgi:hypothetical protein